jgi:hypothetical protein
VIIQADDIPVEVQIRTDLQDSSAQIVERLGDRWGRGLRYGGILGCLIPRFASMIALRRGEV